MNGQETAPDADEQQLLQAARGGDREALATLLGKHQQRVFGFGLKMCGGLCDSLKRTLEVCSSLPTPVVPPHVQEYLRRAVREAIQEGAAVRT